MYFINNYENPLSINITWILLLHMVTQEIIHQDQQQQQQHYQHQQKEKYRVNKGKNYQSQYIDDRQLDLL